MLSNVDKQPGGHYPGAERIIGVWLQGKKQQAERDKSAELLVCVLFSFFLSVCLSSFPLVLVLISLAGTVPMPPICHVALSPRQKRVKRGR